MEEREHIPNCPGVPECKSSKTCPSCGREMPRCALPEWSKICSRCSDPNYSVPPVAFDGFQGVTPDLEARPAFEIEELVYTNNVGREPIGG